MTGEEEEEIVFGQRAKLYRMDIGAWKERGVGELKILRHNQTKKYRILMRLLASTNQFPNHFSVLLLV